jgi:hypothetical protein
VLVVESCDEVIGKENDHLKNKVKRLEFELDKLKKQYKVQPPQDNNNNMVKKLENERTTSNIVSRHQSKQIHHKKEDTVTPRVMENLN